MKRKFKKNKKNLIQFNSIRDARTVLSAGKASINQASHGSIKVNLIYTLVQPEISDGRNSIG